MDFHLGYMKIVRKGNSKMPQSPIRDDGNFAKNFSFPFTLRVCQVGLVWEGP